MRRGLTGLMLALLALDALASDVIAEVGTRLITRDEIERDVAAHGDVGEVLRQRIAGPVLADFLSGQRDLWRLDDAELDAATQAYRHSQSCLEYDVDPLPPERERWVADVLVSGVSAQRYIYDHFGGGRILFQQAGLEAFDANHRLLLDLERQNHFKIRDPVMRAQMFSYWENDASHTFLPDAGRDALDPAKAFITCEKTGDADAPRTT